MGMHRAAPPSCVICCVPRSQTKDSSPALSGEAEYLIYCHRFSNTMDPRIVFRNRPRPNTRRWYRWLDSNLPSSLSLSRERKSLERGEVKRFFSLRTLLSFCRYSAATAKAGRSPGLIGFVSLWSMRNRANVYGLGEVFFFVFWEVFHVVFVSPKISARAKGWCIILLLVSFVAQNWL